MTRIGDNARPIVEAAFARARRRAETVTALAAASELAFRQTKHPEEDFYATPRDGWSPERRATTSNRRTLARRARTSAADGSRR